MKHTKEPWIAALYVRHTSGEATYGVWKDKPTKQNTELLFLTEGRRKPRENAQRMVICVNACAGLTEAEIKTAVRHYRDDHPEARR